MSLADELLADLEENDNEDLEELLEPDEEKPDIKQEWAKMELDFKTAEIHSVRELCKLRDSNRLKQVMLQIEGYGNKIRKSTDIIGPVEADPEYQLIVEANNLAADIDNEIVVSEGSPHEQATAEGGSTAHHAAKTFARFSMNLSSGEDSSWLSSVDSGSLPPSQGAWLNGPAASIHVEELVSDRSPPLTIITVDPNVYCTPICHGGRLLPSYLGLVAIHKFVKDKYQKRFPELDSLVVNPLEYVRTVKELGNDLDQAKSNEVLQQFLTQATIMVVSVTASTTQGTLLTDEEKRQIDEACDMAMELNAFKLKILEYVESRMAFIAPNMSIIVGASIAAKIMGIAGGLTKLSKKPACDVQLLGQQKKTLSGFSQVTMLPHTGFVYYCDIVQNTPPDLRRKAARFIANKLILAARVDAQHSSPDGRIGRQLKDEIERKLDKLQEPPPVKFVKPLPKPIDQPKKKRGGKRVRKMKERYALTEFRKHANRMNFADIEDDAYQEDLGYTRGTIGKAGTGRIRLPQVDEKTKVRISKTLQKNLQKQQIWGGSTTVKKQISGTASSVAFTPLQGLEIVNPQAAEVKMNEGKYFSNTSEFLKTEK